MISHSLSYAARLLCGVILIAASRSADAGVTGLSLAGELTGAGVSTVFATHAPGRPNELFVVDQRGLIQVLNLDTGVFNPSPFLDIQGLVDDGGNEQGLLGLAFDPDFETNGHFYVNYTRDPGPGLDRTRIDRYTAPNPQTDLIVSSGTQSSVLEFEQDFSNHNGGWIGFSPTDGYLYIASGDGGSSDDPNNRGQSLNTRLGKMLRVDPDGDDFPLDATENYRVPPDNPFIDGDPDTFDEIWAYGLRNPWRSSFDRATGDLWIGDVGQGAREEISFVRDGVGGANFGWRLREGDIENPASVGGDEPADHVPPVYDYESFGSGLFAGDSVVGGYVYRGPDPEVQGRYFFADTVDSRLWTFDPADPDGTVENIEADIDPLNQIITPVSFGEDAAGNLYVINRGGQIYRFETDAILGDADGDGDVDGDDLIAVQTNFGATGPEPLAGDADRDGDVDGDDLIAVQTNFASTAALGVPEPGGLALLIGGMSLAAGSRRFSAERRRTSGRRFARPLTP